MILKDTLKGIVRSQREEISNFDYGIERENVAKIEPNVSFAVIISGVRRCGKSTLLRQLIKKLNGFYYFNFEDPKAINFEVGDFQKLNEVFKEEYGSHYYYFFDEIQNVHQWELFVRAMLDKDKKIVITGSNASLLSKELGTRLTGRHLRYELFPFSYREFLNFTNKKPNINSFQHYFIKGGFPEYLKFNNAQILQELLNDILVRDIAVRYNIRSIKTLKEMALYLITNIGKEFSYNLLKRTFDLGSTNTVIDFVSYFEDSYLLFTIQKFDYSLKKQLVNPKKIYSIDNGLSNANSTSFSGDKGRMLENIVFINLRKKYKEIFYFQEKNECDFVVKQGTNIRNAIQVCYDLNEDNKKREINGILGAMKKFKLKEGLILTYDQEDKIKTDNSKIIIMPVWKWLMQRKQMFV